MVGDGHAGVKKSDPASRDIHISVTFAKFLIPASMSL
jgi:hypothetical protein